LVAQPVVCRTVRSMDSQQFARLVPVRDGDVASWSEAVRSVAAGTTAADDWSVQVVLGDEPALSELDA